MPELAIALLPNSPGAAGSSPFVSAAVNQVGQRNCLTPGGGSELDAGGTLAGAGPERRAPGRPLLWSPAGARRA